VTDAPLDELRRVYRTHVRAVYAFHAYAVDAHTAEDLTSATFERVLRAWPTFDAQKSSERTWLLAIARNLLIDHFRRRAHRAMASTDEHPALLDTVTTAIDPAELRISVENLKAWLSELRPRSQEIVALRYGADLRAAEIARLLGLTEPNVHQILSRALRQLRAVADRDLNRSA
jgi:RNA polymerase sigma-70 factor (ECF subfamily)